LTNISRNVWLLVALLMIVQQALSLQAWDLGLVLAMIRAARTAAKGNAKHLVRKVLIANGKGRMSRWDPQHQIILWIQDLVSVLETIPAAKAVARKIAKH